MITNKLPRSMRQSQVRRSISGGSNSALETFGFFSVATDSLLAEVDACEERLRTGKVGIHVSMAGISSAEDAAMLPLMDFLDSELARVSEYILSQLENIESFSQALLTSTTATIVSISNQNIKKEAMDMKGKATRYQRKVYELRSLIISLNSFVRQNSEKFRNVARIADQRIGTSCLAVVDKMLSGAPWSTVAAGGGEIIPLLSDIYNNIRTIEANGEAGADKWEAPSSFERSTHKYWVEGDKLVELLLAAVTEIPLLVYGRGGRLSKPKDKNINYQTSTLKSSDGGGDRLWSSLTTPISSIYFDSDSMTLYNNRIIRSEGAQLLRVRWYGDRPIGKEVLFLELKTHHEKWVNTKSVKERVTICECDMGTLFNIDTGYMNSLNENKAKEMVLRAIPNIKDKNRDEAIDLLLRCHSLIVKHQLRPCVRTKYLRAAFQSPTSNELRLTIDRSITMIDETGAPPGSWCLPDDAQISISGIFMVPCSVFEVKLSGSDSPEFIQHLESSGTIVDGHKFSKFLTGAAVFNGDKVDTLPYWANVPLFKGTIFSFKEQNDSNSELPRTKNDIQEPCSQSSYKNRNRRESKIEWIEDNDSKWIENGDTALNEEANKVSQEENGLNTQSGNTGGLITGRLLGLRKRRKEKSVAAKAPARVEPKTYFANERTFIQWISASLLMVASATLLLERPNSNSRAVGTLIYGLAMAICVYALFLYFRRIYLMTNGKAYGYTDHFGPVVLTLSILTGISASIYFFYSGESITLTEVINSALTISSKPGHCDQVQLEGVSLLGYQPSDSLVDYKKGILLVPSLNVITAISLDSNSSNNQVRVIADVPGADFEALTYVGSSVYAISESTEVSELIIFEWNAEGTLSLMERWGLPGIPNSEGIAFAPGTESGSGKLYISADMLGTGISVTERGKIAIYDIPFSKDYAKNGSLKHNGLLNKKIISEGLLDSKIGSMQYFESVLYLLHDNVCAIHGWDLEQGKMLVEIPLPQTAGSNCKGWEGIGLQRIAPKPIDRRLRSSATSVPSLRLYLAQDTPPEVWSIGITLTGNTFNFPICFGSLIS